MRSAACEAAVTSERREALRRPIGALRAQRMALVADFVEEDWPSMSLPAEMLLRYWPEQLAGTLSAALVRPAMNRGFRRVPLVGRRKLAWNADRFWGRYVQYPRHLRREARRFDLFHVIDHSYAHLLRDLPVGVSGVFCHDVDAFGALFARSARSRAWHVPLARYLLQGMQRASVVFYSTAAVSEQIRRHQLVDPARLVHAPYGVAPEFVPETYDPEPAELLLREFRDRPFVMHVGSCIPRKRIDVLIDVFAELRRQVPELVLVKIGGEFAPEHARRIDEHALGRSILHLRDLSRDVLASLYRGARLVLVTSDAEGFGMPVIEALGCGTRVLASDIAPVREAGGAAASYAPAGDVGAFVRSALELLQSESAGPSRADRLAHAAQFTWGEHARIIGHAYASLVR
jgi:glycosyltransferase involved in cell wall biosynthesis